MAQAGDMVQIDRQGAVALCRLNTPPANVLSHPLRDALMQALDRLAADPGVQAVVLAGAGPQFSFGLDLRELDAPQASPTNAALADRIETLGKPVVAAIAGTCAGVALELALAATARVAQNTAHVVMGDLGLGLTPSAGGSQRLPRLLGANLALDLMLTATPVAAGKLPQLFDDLTDDDPVPRAVALAQTLIDTPRPATRDRDDGFADPAAFQAEIVRRRAEVEGSPLPASRDIVAAVEAAMLLPFEAGCALEQAVFEDARLSAPSRAQRHVVLSEKRAMNMPEAAPGNARQIATIGIVGGGPTACGIARLCLVAGLPVIHFERSEAALASARARLEDDKTGPAAPMQSWRGTSALADLGQADLIIEAVADVLKTKEQVFAALSEVAGEGAIIATQSGLLPIDPIAAATARPAHVLGLHFHAPIGPSRLVEVIPGAQTAPWAIASVAALVRGRLGRVAVRCGTGGGALPERIMAAARDAGLAMLALGVPIERIDRVIAQWGIPQGLFRQIDMIGPELVLTRGRLMARDPDWPGAHLDALDRLIEGGRTGRAAGAGFYRWDEAGRAHVDGSLGAALFGDAPDPMRMDEDEIRLRVIAAMANEGARMLRADMALRPADIDVACVLGVQFPRWRGGPMKAADLTGLFEIQRALTRLQAEWPALYSPDPGIAALVRNGEDFDVLNRIGRNRRRIPG